MVLYLTLSVGLLVCLSLCWSVCNAFQVLMDLGVLDPRDRFFFFGTLPNFFRIFLVFWQVSKIFIFMDLGVLEPRDHFWFFGRFQFIFYFWQVSKIWILMDLGVLDHKDHFWFLNAVPPPPLPLPPEDFFISEFFWDLDIFASPKL